MQNCLSNASKANTAACTEKFCERQFCFYKIMMIFALKNCVFAEQPFRAQPAENGQNGGFSGEVPETSTLN